MSDINEKYKFMTPETSAKNKTWACGSSVASNYTEFVIKNINGKFIGECMTVKYAPANMKIIDEVIVNAIDHFIRCLGTKNPVTTIIVDFDQTGRVRVFNDGPGVEVAIHPEASEILCKQIWVPTMIFGMMYQGSNAEKPSDCIIGGTNGLGAKLAVLYSTDAIIETTDKHNFFVQRWQDHKNIENEPIIINLQSTDSKKLTVEKKKQHTVLSFLPDYAETFKIDIKEKQAQYNDILRTRMILAGAYIGYTLKLANNKQKFDLTFNSEKIPTVSIASVAEMLFPGCTYISTIITPVVNTKVTKVTKVSTKITKAAYHYPWEVCIVVTNNNYAQKHLSIVNGIVVLDGNHIKHINNLVVAAVSEKITKLLSDKNLKFNSSHVTKNMFILLNTKIPNPEWTGQMKNVLDIDIKKLAGYKLDAKFINSITDKLKDQIIESIFNETNKPKTKAATIDIGDIKYDGADYAKIPNKTHLASLIITEGDSAKAQADIGITNKLSRREYGTMSTGGVPMNARKEYNVIETANGLHIKKSTKIEKNAFMTALIAKVGLNEQYKYDPSTTSYKKEMASLRYGKSLIICVDQDLDGKGNILGLILSMFAMLWPCLIDSGYLKWFCTPIMRSYAKKGNIMFDFYNIVEFDVWKEMHDIADYKIEYYKGLATHDRDETISMFGNMIQHLYSFRIDPRASDLFNVYYGKVPDLRKVELAKPSRVLSKEVIIEQNKQMIINCSDYLETEANEYQKDNLLRKLDHVIDGQNQAGRKILDGILKTMKPNIKQKVEKIAGPISELENYHHGGASLESSIQGKAFVTPGGKQIPVLIPNSYLGSRLCGGDDSGSARYTDVTLNSRLTKLLFPADDYYTLEFNFEDGKRGEPKYFIPILPLVVLESTCLPAHGWKLKKWARDVFSVIKNVRQLITYDDDIRLFEMPPAKYAGSVYEWKGEFKQVRGKLCSFGKYEIINATTAQPTIRITELPLRVWTNNYIEMLNKKAKEDQRIIADIRNTNSNDLVVDIMIDLKPSAMELLNEMNDLCFTDGIEEYFQLRDFMDENINLMGINNVVHEFTNYIQPVYHWFKARKNHYGVRIDRIRKLLELEIIMVENMIRYATEAVSLKGMTDDEQIANVKSRNFLLIASGKLNNPKFIPNAELEDVILHGSKSTYDYLLNMTDRQKSTQSIEKMAKELEKIIIKLNELNEVALIGRFPGAKLFEQEIDEFERVFIEGQKTFWKFENYGRYKM